MVLRNGRLAIRLLLPTGATPEARKLRLRCISRNAINPEGPGTVNCGLPPGSAEISLPTQMKVVLLIKVRGNHWIISHSARKVQDKGSRDPPAVEKRSVIVSIRSEGEPG